MIAPELFDSEDLFVRQDRGLFWAYITTDVSEKSEKRRAKKKKLLMRLFFLAEKVGFEPARRFRVLRDFEDG